MGSVMRYMVYREPKEFYPSSTHHCKRNPAPPSFHKLRTSKVQPRSAYCRVAIQQSLRWPSANHLKFHISQGTKVISTLLPLGPQLKIAHRSEFHGQTLLSHLSRDIPFLHGRVPNMIPVYCLANYIS